MLERKDVVKGQKYLLGGEIVTVISIHKPGSGESVSLVKGLPDGVSPWSPAGARYWVTGTMQMRKFQKAAQLLTEV